MSERTIIDYEGLLDEINTVFERARRDLNKPLLSRKHVIDIVNTTQVNIKSHIAMYTYVDNCEVVKVEPPPCQHKWRDCEYWYLEYKASNEGFTYKIFEPYYCIHCGERNDIMLESGKELITQERPVEKLISEFLALYPQLRPRAVVEDIVNDAIKVDREYLKIYDRLHGDKCNAEEQKIILKLNDEKEES